jgi:NADH:ubiquinone oxidoreductase subunit 6 (subunit J)
MEVITMDFQWGPRTAGLTRNTTDGRYIILQKDDTSSSVLYKSTRYNVDSVQIAQASHSKWLLTDPGAENKEDLIITLKATEQATRDTYILIVIPIIRGGSSEPAYLANVEPSAPATVPYDLGSCLPPKTGPDTGNIIFAMYSTCINGYADRVETQNVYVLVSTSGIPVSNALMNRITAGVTFSNSGNSGIYKPHVFTYMPPRVETEIALSDFLTYVTTTRYLTDTTAQELVEQRRDKTDQYKCMELNPENQVDDNGHIIIDINKGEIKNNTLKDIMAERAILKQMVAPGTTDAVTRKMIGTITGYVVAFALVLLFGAGILFFIDTSLGNVSKITAGIGAVIFIIFICATSVGLAGYKMENPEFTRISYYLAATGAALFVLWVPWWWQTTKDAATKAAAASTGGVAASTAPAGFDLTTLIPKIPVYGVVAVVSLLGGFIIGSFF